MSIEATKARLSALQEVWSLAMGEPSRKDAWDKLSAKIETTQKELNLLEAEERKVGIIRPLFDRIVCEVLSRETVTKGGIIIPDTSTGRANRAKVIATGRGERLRDGSRRAPDVAPGEQVIFNPYAVRSVIGQVVHGSQSAEPGDRFIIDEQEILAVDE